MTAKLRRSYTRPVPSPFNSIHKGGSPYSYKSYEIRRLRARLLGLRLTSLSAALVHRGELSDTGAMLKVGILSDTHGLLRPQVNDALAGVDHIIHAGDIGRPEIIEALRRIAPVTAIRGNIDTAIWAQIYPDSQMVNLGGRCFYVLHDLKTLRDDPRSSGIDVIVSGHSHRPRIETIDGVLYLNPGSCGPRRFSLPVTVATLALDENRIEPRLRYLDATAR